MDFLPSNRTVENQFFGKNHVVDEVFYVLGKSLSEVRFHII